MKETAERQEAATPEPAVAQPALQPLTEPARVLALQRTAGNRAVAQLLAREDVTQVTKFVKEETTGADNVTWTAKFEVEFDEAAETPTCWLRIRLKTNRDGDVTKEEEQDARIRATSRFSLIWGSKFILHEHRTILADREWLLRPRIVFVDEKPHLTVQIHKGKGADNRQNWYTESPEWTYAHEVSHQMGLLDEYASDSAPKRKVYDDHSIMGDYVNEGLAEAEAKLRHGERLAKLIGDDTDKDLKARKR